MTLSLSDCLIFSAIIFSISIAGIILNRKNLITLLMSIELMLLAVNTNFIAFSHFVKNAGVAGEVFVFFVLTVAAAEAAIGLAIVVVFFRSRRTIAIDSMSKLKG